MKFMVTWRAHTEKRLDLWKLWASATPEQRADVGPDLKLIGRWHNPVDVSGVAIVESNDATALSRYLCRWSTSMDLESTPVLDDEEAAVHNKLLLADLEQA